MTPPWSPTINFLSPPSKHIAEGRECGMGMGMGMEMEMEMDCVISEIPLTCDFIIGNISIDIE